MAADLAALGLELISGAVLSVIYATAVRTQGAVTRSREFMADAVAVQIIKDANPLVSALRKIERQDHVSDVPTAFLATMISGPSIGWLATHPTVDERIAILRAYGGADAPAAQPIEVRRPAVSTTPLAPQPTARRPRIVQGVGSIPTSIRTT